MFPVLPVALSLGGILLLYSVRLAAQEDRLRQRPPAERPQVEEEEDRIRDVRPRGREAPPRARERGERGEEVRPTLVPPGRREGRIRPPLPRWRLGIYADSTDTGALVTRVSPNSPAWESGLEEGDRIVTVGGFQIGYVDGALFDLGDELQLRADRNGRVTLLVQNRRNLRLVNLEVTLERRRP